MIKVGFFFDAFQPKNVLAMVVDIAIVPRTGERLISNSIKKIEDGRGDEGRRDI